MRDMGGYTKLFGSILDSTVWDLPSPVRIVWVTMMAMADRDGVVESSVPGLAKRAVVTRADCEHALDLFLSPDVDSRTKDHDGRRIAKVDGGWKLLNYEVYRQRASAEEVREKARDRKRKQRERQSRSSRDVTDVPRNHDIAEAEAEAEAENVLTTLVRSPTADAARPPVSQSAVEIVRPENVSVVPRELDVIVRTAVANPLVAGRRREMELELQSVIREHHELEPHRDPTEIMAEASSYPGQRRLKTNPAALSDDRLAATLLDAKNNLAEVKREQAGGGPILGPGVRRIVRD